MDDDRGQVMLAGAEVKGESDYIGTQENCLKCYS